MQKFYADAFLTRPPIVFGKQLVPLTLGHWYLLMACDSPFVLGGELHFDDLIFAVWLCSQPSGMPDCIGARSKILDNSFQKECKKWGKSLDKLRYEFEQELLRDYIKTYTQFPPRGAYNSTDGSGKRRRCSVPYVLAYVWRIAPIVGEDRAWNMPATQALAYHAAACDSDGDPTLISEEEEQANNELDIRLKVKEQGNGG